MFQIQPYDLSEKFKLIPYSEKFQLTLWHNNSVKFKSKRTSLEFISKISQLFSEVVTISEIIFSNVLTYSFHLKPLSRSKSDKYQIFHNNSAEIQTILTELKYYQKAKCELYQVIKRIDNLLLLLADNCTILNKKNSNCVIHHTVILQKVTESLQKVLTQPLFHFHNNTMSIFY